MPPLFVRSRDPATIGFVGCGMMGGAMARGLHSSGTCTKLIATEIVPERVPDFVSKCASNGALALGADVVVFAVEPKDMPAVCAEVKDNAKAGQLYVSLAAGVTLASLESWLPAEVPIVRVMPNTPCVVGQQAAGFCCNQQCGTFERDLVAEMLGALGTAVLIDDEDNLDAVTGVSGSGPAYVFQFIEAMR